MHRQRSYIHEVHVSRATGQHNDVVPGGDGRHRPLLQTAHYEHGHGGAHLVPPGRGCSSSVPPARLRTADSGLRAQRICGAGSASRGGAAVGPPPSGGDNRRRRASAREPRPSYGHGPPPSWRRTLGLGSLFRADAQTVCPLNSRSTRSPLDFRRNQASGSPARRPICDPHDILKIHGFHWPWSFHGPPPTVPRIPFHGAT